MSYSSAVSGLNKKHVLKILKLVYELTVLVITIYDDCKKGRK